MVGLALVPLPGANYVTIADEFYKRMDQIKKEVPSDIKLNIALDQTVFIKRAISEVQETLLISFLLVVLIIYLFFRDALIAFRPLIDIPVSLIASFFIMYMFGFSINVLTMLAIVLATGLVVDDGIVVTENIYKKLEGGMNKYRAAKEGSREIFFAVISTSITLAVVFLPIVFLQGFVGRLFREFGIVVAGAVLISAFVSLTLTPVLSVKLTRENHEHGWFYKFSEPFFVGLENGYSRFLASFMKIRWMAFVIIVFCIASVYFLIQIIQSELAPLEDRNQFRLAVSAPEGTSYDYMDAYVDKLVQFMEDSVPEARILLSVTAPGFSGAGSVNTAFVRATLSDPKDRNRSQQQIVDMVGKNLPRFPQGRASAIQEQTGGLGADSSIECVGAAAAVDTAIRSVRGGGTISMVGVPSVVTGEFPYLDIWLKSLTFRAGWCNVQAYMRPLLDLIAAGRLKPDLIISHRMKLDDAAEAYRMFDAHEATKIVLTP